MSQIATPPEKSVKGKIYMKRRCAYIIHIFDSVDRRKVKEMPRIYLNYDEVLESDLGEYFPKAHVFYNHIKKRCDINRGFSRKKLDFIYIQKLYMKAPSYVYYNKKSKRK
jgi:hypothetical protein